MSYTKEQLLQFINDVAAGRQPDSDIMKAAMYALHDHIAAGININDKFKIKRKIGGRGKSFDPLSINPSDPIFIPIMEYAGDQRKHKDVKKIIMAELHVSNSTAERILRSVKPRALKAYQLKLWLMSQK